MTIEEFRATLLHHIFDGQQIHEYRLTDDDWVRIREIAEARYRNWDRNFGRSPEFNVHKSQRFPIGSIDVRLNVKNGVIEGCKIYGDVFGMGEIRDVEEKLVGRRYAYEDVAEAVTGIDMSFYFGDITHKQFVELIL